MIFCNLRYKKLVFQANREWGCYWTSLLVCDNVTLFLCFVDCASLYNVVNKANLVHSLFLVYLFLVYLSISTCFGRLCAHRQEKQLYLCDTWYLLFCVDGCLVCRLVIHTE